MPSYWRLFPRLVGIESYSVQSTPCSKSHDATLRSRVTIERKARMSARSIWPDLKWQPWCHVRRVERDFLTGTYQPSMIWQQQRHWQQRGGIWQLLYLTCFRVGSYDTWHKQITTVSILVDVSFLVFSPKSNRSTVDQGHPAIRLNPRSDFQMETTVEGIWSTLKG